MLCHLSLVDDPYKCLHTHGNVWVQEMWANFDDDFNALTVYLYVCVFECVFTGCSREGAKITANDRISVGHGTGWATGKGFVYNPVPLLFPLPSGKNSGRTTFAKPALDQNGHNTEFTTITGQRRWYKGEARNSTDTTSCRKSLLRRKFNRHSTYTRKHTVLCTFK